MTQNSFIIDQHVDLVMSLYEKGDEYKTKSQISYQQLKSAHVKVIFSGFSYDDEFGDTEKQLELLQHEVKENNIQLIKNISDYDKCLSMDSLGMLLHLEGAKTIKDARVLQKYFDRGVRSIGFTHNHGNHLASGCMDDPNQDLTPLGKEIVKQASNLGMVIDAAHINKKGFYSLLELSQKPVIISHGNCYEVCNSPRNFNRDQIVALSQQGGVMGVFFSSAYVHPDKTQASLDTIVEHCLRIIDYGGMDCLAIGSDFGGITTGLPKGLSGEQDLPILLTLLEQKGLTKNDIAKISWQNTDRVIRQVLTN